MPLPKFCQGCKNVSQKCRSQCESSAEARGGKEGCTRRRRRRTPSRRFVSDRILWNRSQKRPMGKVIRVAALCHFGTAGSARGRSGLRPRSTSSNPCRAQHSPAPPQIPRMPRPVAAPQTEEEKRLAELLKLKFDRSPASILQAQTTLAEATTGCEPRRTISSECRCWSLAGGRRVSENVARERSDAGLRICAQRLRPTSSERPTAAPAAGRARAIADAAPRRHCGTRRHRSDPLKEEQLKLLGALLTRVLAVNSFLDPLVARLDEGTGNLGEKILMKRDHAAQLLLNANRPADAAKFLPPLELGTETASLALLEKHVMTIFSLGRQEQKNDAIQRAWELNQMILASPECPAALRERAWRRCGDIARFFPAQMTLRG